MLSDRYRPWDRMQKFSPSMRMGRSCAPSRLPSRYPILRRKFLQTWGCYPYLLERNGDQLVLSTPFLRPGRAAGVPGAGDRSPAEDAGSEPRR